ncbi:MAG TPA: carbon-nitrogen hydrolase family protein [Symbiobacteriaceae bacterium]|jgi:predicted amidohydrolase|nr:carbon-nitrogen hydrolase family protein [Symbiobacteriaceae bacterium]
MSNRVRIASIQFDHCPVTGFDQFAAQVRNFVRLAEDDRCQLVVFPEYLTGPLFGVDPDCSRWTGPYMELFAGLARSTGMTILGGTHLTERGAKRYNTAHLFLPDGETCAQDKIHMTPGEGDVWGLERGAGMTVVDAPFGRVGINICFDSEFPECAAVAAEAGADILLVPSATSDRAGFWRVRHCCHARAVENQMYVVHSALVGGLPNVRCLEAHWGTSAILTPCDVPFPPRGVMAEGEWNQGLCVVGEVDLDLLYRVRREGSVLPRLERRPEAYRISKPDDAK